MIEKARRRHSYGWVRKKDRPHVDRAPDEFAGNAGVLLRAYMYARLLGREGMPRVAEYATLNANYLAKRLAKKGFDSPIRSAAPPTSSSSPCAAEEGQRHHRAGFLQVLLDHGIHAPTNYFPLLVPECLLIEPTETESKETLDQFVVVMASCSS